MRASQRILFDRIGLDLLEWKRYFQQNQQEYIRLRLRIVKAFSEGLSRIEIAQHFKVADHKIRRDIKKYLEGGLALLVKPQTRKQPTRLTQEQEQAFKQTLLTSKPCDHQLDGNIWTGQHMIDYLEKTYQVVYRSGIYDLLYRLKLSHQKAHQDYGNADEATQKQFLERFEHQLATEPTTTAFLFVDEFSVQQQPTTYYGWAERNTRPKVVTDQKKKGA